jgi:AcrR family transcriptional regulator
MQVEADSPTVREVPGDDLPRLRADAQRNLALILAAARTVFARRGLDATLDEVAREAGLGVATVYRRFHDKSELAEALFEEDLELLVGDAEAAEACADPWDGFVTFLGGFLERQASDCGLRDLVSSTAFGSERFATLKERIRPAAERIVRRAQEAGALRPDFDAYDIPVLGVMLGAVVDFSRGARPDTWKRYLAIILDGLQGCPRAVAERELPSPPLTDSELETAMGYWRPRHR